LAIDWGDKSGEFVSIVVSSPGVTGVLGLLVVDLSDGELAMMFSSKSGKGCGINAMWQWGSQ
jgi:hypothetical protein